MTQSVNLDDLLPIRIIYVAGSRQPFMSGLDFASGFSFTTTQDPVTGGLIGHVSPAADTVLEGASAMTDADYNVSGTVIPAAGKSYVGCVTQFTADRAFWLPPSPTVGAETTWADECTTAGGSLLNHNAVFKTSDGTQIMAGPTGQTGGNTLAATYTATHAAWGTGATITLFFNGTFWKCK